MKKLKHLLFICFVFFCQTVFSFSFDDLTFSTGAINYSVKSNNKDWESEAYVNNMVARIEADWEFLEHFFMNASGKMSVFNENDRERVFFQNKMVENNSFLLEEKSLEVVGGVKIASLLHPFMGVSFTELKLERSSPDIQWNDDQMINAYDLLVGFKGSYIFNDYTSIGYQLTYQTSPNSEADMNQSSFHNVDSSKLSSEIFFKYWLPNELWQVGLHLYGGKYSFDKKSAENDLLPDTDIKFVGAFLSLKFNL